MTEGNGNERGEYTPRVICMSEVIRYARELRRRRYPSEEKDLRVSNEYLDVLEQEVRRLIRFHVKVNLGKRTMKADVFLLKPAPAVEGQGQS